MLFICIDMHVSSTFFSLDSFKFSFLVAPSKRSDLSGHCGVCMDGCMYVVLLDNFLLDNCLTEKSITYIHKGIFSKLQIWHDQS